jgi:hypothetical protein
MPQATIGNHHQSGCPAASKAPTARSIPAWGVAPGTGTHDAQGLKARPIHISIPQIPFIKSHSIFLKKCTELILKRLLPVMHFLTIDVLNRARQSNSEVNVVRNSSYTKTLTFGVADNGSKICAERGVNGWFEERHTVLCAEDYMDQNKRERLRHRLEYRSGFQPFYSATHRTWGFTPCWYNGAPLALSPSAVAILVFCLLLPSIALAQSPPLHIRIINAQTNKPIPNERLNVALRVDQIGSVAMATDKNGIILVDYGKATIIRILANMYADCRPRAELYTNYPIDAIVKNGITTGNLCSGASPKAKPGELILFEIPKTFIPSYPAPPLPPPPHSDENPHVPPQ